MQLHGDDHKEDKVPYFNITDLDRFARFDFDVSCILSTFIQIK